jgi:hypothetical protein
MDSGVTCRRWRLHNQTKSDRRREKKELKSKVRLGAAGGGREARVRGQLKDETVIHWKERKRKRCSVC